MTVPARIASLSWLLCHHRGTLEPCDVHETVEHLLACGTEIQQAGDLVDAKATELVRHCAAYVRCPHQRCVREVPIEGNVQQFRQEVRPDLLRIDFVSSGDAASAVGGELFEADGRLEISRKVRLDDAPHMFDVLSNKGMEHQRDTPRRGIESRFAARLTIDSDLLVECRQILDDQMRQYIRPDMTGAAKCLDVAG